MYVEDVKQNQNKIKRLYLYTSHLVVGANPSLEASHSGAA